jgi:hypothetical protein
MSKQRHTNRLDLVEYFLCFVTGHPGVDVYNKQSAGMQGEIRMNVWTIIIL